MSGATSGAMSAAMIRVRPADFQFTGATLSIGKFYRWPCVAKVIAVSAIQRS
jgi:hypothetical protein